MAHTFSVRVITPSAVTSGTAAMMIRASATNRPSVRRIFAQVFGAPALTQLDLYRVPAGTAMGTPNVSVLGQGLASSLDTSVTNVDTAWSAQPSIAGLTPFDGITIAGVIGTGQYITLPDEFTLDVSSGLLVYSTVAGSQLRLTPYWQE